METADKDNILKNCFTDKNRQETEHVIQQQRFKKINYTAYHGAAACHFGRTGRYGYDCR